MAEGAGGGYDIGVSASSSSTAGNAAYGDTFGDIIAGGSKIPTWLPLAVIAGVVVVAVVWIVSRVTR